MISGIVIAGLGSAAMAVGGVLSAYGYAFCNLSGPDDGTSCVPTLGLILLGAGAGTAVLIGIPMAIVGNHDVPRDDQQATPCLILAPGAAALRWSF